MATLNFNATEVTPSSTLKPIPAGKYQAVIVESELKMTKSGTGSYLELTFEIISGEFAKRRLWARLNIRNSNPKAVEIAQKDLSAICYAINVLHPQDSSELHDKPLTVTVRCVKNLDTGDIQNEIKETLYLLLIQRELLRKARCGSCQERSCRCSLGKISGSGI